MTAARTCDVTALKGDDVQDNCLGAVFGDQCMQWCAPGYTGGNVTLTCSKLGTFWGDWLECIPLALETAQGAETIGTIAGFVELDIDDPVAFIKDASALRALRQSVADLAGVPKEYVELTARELNGTEATTSTVSTTSAEATESTTGALRRLYGGNVIISFVIRIPASDTAASQKFMSGSMEAAIRSKSAEVALTDLLTNSPIFAEYSATIQDIDMSRKPEMTAPNPVGALGQGAGATPRGAFISGIVVSIIGCGCISVGICAYALRPKTKGKNIADGSSDSDDSSKGDRAREHEKREEGHSDAKMDFEPSELFSVDELRGGGKVSVSAADAATDMAALDACGRFALDGLLQDDQPFALDDCIHFVSSSRQVHQVEENQQLSLDAAISGMSPRSSAQGHDPRKDLSMLSTASQRNSIGDGGSLSRGSVAGHVSCDPTTTAPPACANIKLSHNLQEQVNSVASLEWDEGEDDVVIAI